MASNRRSQDANAPRPALKVIGFRVEGVPPSPDQLHSLAESTEGGGSPDPVIIPPQFSKVSSSTETNSCHKTGLSPYLPLFCKQSPCCHSLRGKNSLLPRAGSTYVILRHKNQLLLLAFLFQSCTAPLLNFLDILQGIRNANANPCMESKVAQPFFCLPACLPAYNLGSNNHHHSNCDRLSLIGHKLPSASIERCVQGSNTGATFLMLLKTSSLAKPI